MSPERSRDRRPTEEHRRLRIERTASSISRPALPTLRRAAYFVYVAAVVSIVAIAGVPQNRVVLVVLVLTLLTINCIGHGRRSLWRMLIDWLPFVAVLLAYDESRRLSDNFGVPVHEADIVRAEERLFDGAVPTVWLQRHLFTPGDTHWYDAACTLVYTSHFLVTPILAAVLWLTSRDAWLRYVTRVVVLSIAALVTYVAFPEVPPWLAAKDGVIGSSQRLSAEGWVWLHVGNLKTLLARAQEGGSNPVAAMPSVHTALAVLASIAIASSLSSRWRWLLALYPMAMGFALVYDGEHYVWDVLLGIVYAVIVHFGVNRWEATRGSSTRSLRSACQ